MAAELKGMIWLNKCGTYGIASAQLYWGRMAALLLRIMYLLFPHMLWAFVYVDDFITLTRRKYLLRGGLLPLLFLLAVGCPLSWKKTMIGVTNVWLGYQLCARTAWATMTPTKAVIISQLLMDLMLGALFRKQEIEEGVGRLNWATQAFPFMRPFLQPMYAWMTATKSSGKPSKIVKAMATCIYYLLMQRQVGLLEMPRLSKWTGASDAAASSETAGIGGWLSKGQPADKSEVEWFAFRPTSSSHKWMFDKRTPQQRIAALEMYGTLLLFVALSRKASQTGATTHLPMRTDNQGNAYSILKDSTKRWPGSAVLMEICVQAHLTSCCPAIEHVGRDNNTWADDLSNLNTRGFSQELQIPVDSLEKELLALPIIFTMGD